MSSPCPEIQAIDAAQKRTLPPFRPGDTVKVHYRIREGDKERIQIFQGVVLRKRSGGVGATFTVRKMSYGVGVERIFPVHSPRIERLEIVSRAHVRRARLYYLRDLTGKAARLRQSKKLSGDLTRLVQIDPTEKKTKRKRGKKRKAAAKAKKAAG